LKIKILLNMIFLLVVNCLMVFSNSKFDSVEWVFSKIFGNVEVYIQSDTDLPVYYYKASTIVENRSVDEIVAAIKSFDRYPSIFPKTSVFNTLLRLDDKSYLVYALINFSPIKNRDYIILIEEYTRSVDGIIYNYIEWGPPPDTILRQYEISDSKAVRVRNITGRWTIYEQNSKVHLSFECNNHWELNVPLYFLREFEKKETANAVFSILGALKK